MIDEEFVVNIKHAHLQFHLLCSNEITLRWINLWMLCTSLSPISPAVSMLNMAKLMICNKNVHYNEYETLSANYLGVFFFSC